MRRRSVKLWKDSEYRAMKIQKAKEQFERPGTRESAKTSASKLLRQFNKDRTHQICANRRRWQRRGSGKRQSTAMKVKWKDKGFHSKMIAIQRARCQTPAFREERRQVALRLWKTTNLRYKIIHARKKFPNRYELFCQESLVKLGEPFFAEKRIENLITADLVLANRKVAIFVEGCYWHACQIHFPGHYILRGGKTSEEVRAFDYFVYKVLRIQGWTVIRVWSCEIKEDNDIAGKRVRRVINSHVIVV